MVISVETQLNSAEPRKNVMTSPLPGLVVAPMERRRGLARIGLGLISGAMKEEIRFWGTGVRFHCASNQSLGCPAAAPAGWS